MLAAPGRPPGLLWLLGLLELLEKPLERLEPLKPLISLASFHSLKSSFLAFRSRGGWGALLLGVQSKIRRVNAG